MLISLGAYAEAPQRIISSMPSITEMLYALELDDQIVGVTTNCNYPPEAREKEQVGGFFLNLEKIVSLKPDLIVMLENAQQRDIKRFKDFGLPVKTIDPQTVIGVMGALIELGETTGSSEQAEEIVDKMKQKILSVEARVGDRPRPEVLVVVGYRPLIVVGGSNFIDDVIRYAGAENIVGQAKVAYPQYNFERLIEAPPDYIIITKGVVTREEIKRDGRWQTLQAVKQDRVLFIDADIISRPGPRVIEAIEQIADFIHE